MSSAKSTIMVLLLVLFTTTLQLLIWQNANSVPRGDEIRYLEQANYLLEGMPMYDEGIIFNPPLYPGFLALLMKIGVPETMLNLSGIVLSVLSSLLLFHTLQYLCTLGWAFFLTFLFSIYPPLVQLGSQLMTEVPASFLAILASWLLVQYSRETTGHWLTLTALSVVFAAFALMKPVMAYALLLSLPLSLIAAVFLRAEARSFCWRTALVAAFSLILCTPYLVYTYEKTGNYFSWGTTGGEHLYWMTMSDEDVWGSWMAPDQMESFDYMVENEYAAQVAYAETLNGNDADAYYLSLFKQNMAENPEKYVINVFANIGRLLFNYPYTYRSQSLFTYAYILPNMLIFYLLLFGILLLPVTLHRQPVTLLWYLAIILIYFGGNALISTTGRQGLAFIGPIIIWLTCQFRILISLGIINPHYRS